MTLSTPANSTRWLGGVLALALIAVGSKKTQRWWLPLIAAGCVMGQGYEVWLTDQNNTAGYSAAAPRGTHGGRLVIHDGEDLENPGGPVDRAAVIDLA